MSADKIRRNFYLLALDWVHLRTHLPAPAHSEKGRRPKIREYGHPAQWASDRAAEIAAMFNSWHELLASYRNETPPPPSTAAEQVRVVKAWNYLEPRFEQLVEVVELEALGEVSDLHFKIRRALGLSQPLQVLPVPCPNGECQLRTLTRTISVGRDHITCGTCGYTVVDDVEGKNYEWLARVMLDILIDSAT